MNNIKDNSEFKIEFVPYNNLLALNTMSHSKQTNFFIVHEDWPLISNFLKNKGVVFIKNPVINKLDLLSDDISSKNEDESFQVYLTKKEYAEKVVLKQQKVGYDVNILESYVIEFSRGGFYPYSDKILYRARFYTVTKYEGASDKIEKDKEFINWIENIYTSFKATFLKKTDLDKDFSFSENAIKWMIENGAKVDPTGLKAISVR
jgi:hypothetical protein